MSNFASRLGWTCDNVASFELVTASGVPIVVSADSCTDLYWKMRGGGENFGVVTNFELSTFALGQLWASASTKRMLSPMSLKPQFAIKGSENDLITAQIVICLHSWRLT